MITLLIIIFFVIIITIIAIIIIAITVITIIIAIVTKISAKTVYCFYEVSCKFVSGSLGFVHSPNQIH